MNFRDRRSGFAPTILSLLRVITALLYMEHATMKLFGFPPSQFQPPLLSLFGAAGVIEIIGSTLLVLGLFTRPVALILSGEMAIAYFAFHLPQSFFPLLNQGEGAILFCFIFLYLVFAGPGPISIDRARGAE